MTSFCRFCLAFSLLIVSAGYTFAGDTKGWFEDGCISADFHFTKFPGRAAGEELQLRLLCNFYPMMPPW